MKRIIMFLLFYPFSILKSAELIPIIFVHGHKGGGNAYAGWETWYPIDYSTAMKKIISEQYGGYKFGLKADGEVAWDCNVNTQLMPNQGTKRIFNFSYYSPDGSPGVIGLTEETVKVYLYTAIVSYLHHEHPESSFSREQNVTFFPYQDNYPPDTTNPLPPPPPPSE